MNRFEILIWCDKPSETGDFHAIEEMRETARNRAQAHTIGRNRAARDFPGRPVSVTVSEL